MAETIFVIEHSAGPAWVDGTPYPEQPGIERHIAFMRSLDERGVLILGGPFTDLHAGAPVGMALVRLGSQEEAEALASGDASVSAGLIRYRVRPWRVPMGSALEA